MKSIVLCAWTPILRVFKFQTSALTLCLLIIFDLLNGAKIAFADTYNVVFKVTKLGASLVAEPTISQYGNAVTLRAKVEGRQPTGQVRFYDDGKKIGDFTLTAEHDGVATLVVTKPPFSVGKHKISAHYQSDQHAAVNDKAEVIVEVNPAEQIIEVAAPQTCTYGQQDCTINASSTSGERITFNSETPNVCSINQVGHVQLHQSGTCTLLLSQGGNDHYRPTDKTITLRITRADTSLSGLNNWIETYAPEKTRPLPTTPASASSAKIAYSIPENQQHIATIDADTGHIHLHGIGQVRITARQAADNQYNASAIHATLTITHGDAQLAWDADRSETYAQNKTIALKTPTSRSTGAYTYSSSNEQVATIDATGRVTLRGVGKATLTVRQAAAGNYGGGQKTVQLTVKAATPTWNLSDRQETFGVSPFNLGLRKRGEPGGVGIQVSESAGTFSYKSSRQSVATINENGEVTVSLAGQTMITVTQAAHGNYAERSKSFTLIVQQAESDFDLDEGTSSDVVTS